MQLRKRWPRARVIVPNQSSDLLGKQSYLKYLDDSAPNIAFSPDIRSDPSSQHFHGQSPSSFL
jgi:hypothetical protein